MKIPIHTVAELGTLIRATRRAHGLRLDDVAGSAKVGTVFAGDVEHGKATVQMGRVLQLLVELGIGLEADVPDRVLPALEKLQQSGIKPRKPRQPSKAKAAKPRAPDGGSDA
jgi:transcriptional regulator with XRE-family HTH domain